MGMSPPIWDGGAFGQMGQPDTYSSFGYQGTPAGMGPGALNFNPNQAGNLGTSQAALSSGTPPPGTTPGAPGAVPQTTLDAQRLAALEKGMQPNQTLAGANMAINGLGMLGQLGLGAWGLYQGHQAFNFQKNMAEKNYANSVKSYDTNMEDKIRARHSSSARMTQEQIDDEVNKRKLNNGASYAKLR
jgi:hypothetical protein